MEACVVRERNRPPEVDIRNSQAASGHPVELVHLPMDLGLLP